jgi:hypothetical protein
MKITKGYSLLLLVIFGLNAHQPVNENYISIEFTADHYENPIPVVIFSVDSVVTDKFLFVGYKFRVNDQEFASLENIIKTGSSYLLIDSLAIGYYEMSIVRNGIKSVYATVNFRKSKELFSKILGLFRNEKNYLEICKAFEYIYLLLHKPGADCQQ